MAGRSIRKSRGRILRRLFTAACIACATLASSAQADLSVGDPTKIRIVPGLYEPLIPAWATTDADDAALDASLREFRDAPNDLSAFERYIGNRPQSGWRIAIDTDLGLAYYSAGYFSKAIEHWERAWRAAPGLTNERAKALADRAIGELLRMHARLGHADRVEELLKEIDGRPLSGSASEAVAGAREGLWYMRHDPGVAYLCGPMALKSLADSLASPRVAMSELDAYRSGPRGVSLGQVAGLADRAGLAYRAIHRETGAPIPVPSIVHWQLDHYAAIVAEHDGLYTVRDPTFGDELRLSRQAIDAEASGYFLVPADASNSGWRIATARERARIHGMGYTTQFDQNGTSQKDLTQGGICRAQNSSYPPLCGYRFQSALVSLNLNDSPVGYRPPRGPAVFTTLTYSQRDANQPAVPTFFNFGPKWTANWLGYVVDNPRIPGANVTRYVTGGGGYSYAGFNAATGRFAPETPDLSVLVRVAADPIRYERQLSDGGREIYAQADGSKILPRRVFLTQLVDPYGNAVTLHYDDQLRLVRLVDAVGRETKFEYELPQRPLLVSRITDPFGRAARIAYDDAGRLASITDVIGLTSSFTYDAGSFITSMTTPYGTTRFAFTESGPVRTLDATDPLGFTEHIEFQQAAPAASVKDSVFPTGMSVYNGYLQFRNTYYWDKLASKRAVGDYTQAFVTHWFHLRRGVAARTVESVKPPLEGRIWFNTPGSKSFFTGTHDVPSLIGRVLDDGTTQRSQIGYNSIGNVASTTDPAGRTTVFAYASNQIDVLGVDQRRPTGEFIPLGQFVYDQRHLPVSYTDSAGQFTRLSYSSAGQLVSVVDPLGNTTRYEYDNFGQHLRTINANGHIETQWTYDALGRVATRTDSQGRTVRFAYDALDRPSQINYPDSTTEIYTWDKLDLASFADRSGRTTRFQYDANRNRTAIVDAQGRTTRFGYFPNGTLESVTAPNGGTTSWERDVESRVTRKVFPDGGADAYAYEAKSGRLSSITDALGQIRRFRYGVDDLVTEIAYENTRQPTPTVRFAYDDVFRRIRSMTDGIGTTSYEYVPAGTSGALGLAREDGPFENDSIALRYDAAGRLAERTLDASAETWAYDPLGRVTSHVSALGTFAFDYLGDTSGLTSQRTSEGAIDTRWTYDSNDNDRRLMGIAHHGARRFEYATTRANVINAITESTAAEPATAVRWDYTYDAGDRLTVARSSADSAFAYDHDSNDTLAPIADETLAYDANGNLIGDGRRTFAWDAEDRLVAITYAAEPKKRTEIKYDGSGRPITIVETNDAGSVETRYLWCGSAPCQTRNAKDEVTRRLFPEGELAPGDTARYYARDHLGSVRDVLDVANGHVLASFDYAPYGATTRQTGDASPVLRYSGMVFLEGSGLYLTRHRVYDPATGRWLSKDPLGESTGLNPHAYADGDPIANNDPTGLAVVITLTDGTTQTVNTAQEFLDYVNTLGPGTIRAIDIIGHANPDSQTFSQTAHDPNALVQTGNGGVYLVGDQVKQDLSALLAGKLAKDAEVFLGGCNTAAGHDSIVQVLSRNIPAAVIGCGDYTSGPNDAPAIMCGYTSQPATDRMCTNGNCTQIPGRPQNPDYADGVIRTLLHDYE